MDGTGEHEWRTRSRHLSQDGVVAYQRCHCGAWRVLVEPGPTYFGGSDRANSMPSPTQRAS